MTSRLNKIFSIRRGIFILFFIFFVVITLFISGCAQKTQYLETQQIQENNQQQMPQADKSIKPLKGITLTPKSFEANDFTDFFEKAKQAGNIVAWAGDWNELGNTKNGGPKVVQELSLTYKYIPVIEAQFFTQSSGKLLRLLDESTKQKYKADIVAFAEKYKPKYLALGIEVNILYEKSPEEFNSFVSFYDEAYDAIKKISPDTKVFTIFQLEKMKGLNGGLFGGKNDPSKSEWELLDKFSKSDIIAFTSYPDLIYKSPSQIPDDYYAEIKSRTNKPIAFTEIGWHSDSSLAGWESSEANQAEFISTFFDLTEGLNKEFVIWSFMYDQKTIKPFDSMGLFDENGTQKPVWTEWLNAK